MSRRSAVLAELKSSSTPLTVAEIADRLGVHVNTVRFHLIRLVETGQVVQIAGAGGTPGRPAQRFRVSAGMDVTAPRRYRELAQALVDLLSSMRGPEGKALAAGRRWGQQLASSQPRGGTPSKRTSSAGRSDARLVRLLDDLGFAPQRRRVDGERFIGLRQCPFLELAASRSDVVCPIHLGLMQGAAETWRLPVTVDTLEPFVRPDLCLAHLTSSGVSDGHS
jgi:predicted ArsR family transcriptional regulator